MIVLPEKSSQMWRAARRVKYILMDVDGVLTNGQIIYDTADREIKAFNAHDGLGITLARAAGLQTGLISARESRSIRKRAAELKIDHLYLGQFRKLEAYLAFRKKMKAQDEEICFIGDDLPDIPVLQRAGFAVAVRNASSPAKNAADFWTRYSGGEGAVREVIEFILFAQGRLEDATKKLIGNQAP